MKIIKIIQGKIKYWMRGIAVFAIKPNEILNGDISAEFTYQELTHTNQFNKYHFPEEKLNDYKTRISKGEIFCILEKHNAVLSSGWINPNPEHQIGELAVFIEPDFKGEVLYDFETDQDYRGKGLYPVLLKNISARNTLPKVIYALVENKPSIKGIRKAGFVHIGNVYGFNKHKLKTLIKQL